MTAVYVLRHPETTWNVAHRYQGRLETTWTREGRNQAKLACRAFAGDGLDAVYTSPLERALFFARELASATDALLVTDERLLEIGQGCWEGLHVDDIRNRYPDLYALWYSRPDLMRFPEGESLSEVRDRALSVLDDLYGRIPHGSVAIVTHSVVAQVMVAAALSLDLRNLHQLTLSNAGITTLCGTETPGMLLSLNNTEALYHSPAASAARNNCSTWMRRTVTQ